KHLTDEPMPLDQLGVSQSLAEVCRRALEKSPDKRYQSVDELYDDLSRSERDPSSQASPSQSPQTQRIPTTTSPRRPDGLLPTVAGGPVMPVGVSGSEAITQSMGQAGLEQKSNSKISGKQLRRLPLFALAGGLVVSLLSLGVGFLLRWLEWGSQPLAYDEYALL